ncbi:MAG TPA: aldose 1-epimerase family protein [Acidimicrobiales bacterium]|nr:aldose 1-epimerase family protein [Acidimicrobiales bacterium]
MRTVPSGRQVRLAAHDQELVAVEVGGGIRAYRASGRDVLEPYAEGEMCAGGRGQLLAPWPNRLRDGSFEWEGRTLQLAVTEPEAGNAIHGLVRWANWQVPEPESVRSPYTPQTPVDSTALTYRLHPQPGWPWPLDLRVVYRLSPDQGLEVRTTVTNLSSHPCPIGFGWHPYLAVPVDECTLTLPAATAYTSDERGIPTGRIAVEGGELDFRTPRMIGPARLDVAFTDLERDPAGRTHVVVEGRDGWRADVWGDATFTHLMLYTGDTLADPARRRRGLAVEPMTGAPDMLHSGDGLRVLEPGATLGASWGVDPFRKW